MAWLCLSSARSCSLNSDNSPRFSGDNEWSLSSSHMSLVSAARDNDLGSCCFDRRFNGSATESSVWRSLSCFNSNYRRNVVTLVRFVSGSFWTFAKSSNFLNSIELCPSIYCSFGFPVRCLNYECQSPIESKILHPMHWQLTQPLTIFWCGTFQIECGHVSRDVVRVNGGDYDGNW